MPFEKNDEFFLNWNFVPAASIEDAKCGHSRGQNVRSIIWSSAAQSHILNYTSKSSLPAHIDVCRVSSVSLVRSIFFLVASVRLKSKIIVIYIYIYFFFFSPNFKGVMELCTKGLSSSVPQMKQRGVNLNCVRTCVVVAEERPRINLTSSFTKLFSALGLCTRAVSTSFGCRVNIATCLQVK